MKKIANKQRPVYFKNIFFDLRPLFISISVIYEIVQKVFILFISWHF